MHVSGYSLNSGGVLLDITDQGVGMGAEEMAHANWRLDNPPVVDVAVSRRMGLFVVARLAARHGIVRLRPASKGGLTALVWPPNEVITRQGSPSEDHPLGDSGPAPAAWMETGLAAGEDDRPTASIPAARARPLRPAPDQFGNGDAAAETVTGANGSTTFPPASANGTGAATASPGRASPGTGPRASGPEAGPGTPSPGTASPGTASPGTASPGTASPGTASPGAGAPGGPAAHHVVLPPAGSAGPENRLPIFEAVESDWFRRGGHPVGRPAPEPDADKAGWSTPADAGWQAAEAVRAQVFADTTQAGLPKRVPKANLVPGGAGSPAAAEPPAAGRSASQTRQRLSSYQQGIRKARAAAPGDETDISDEAGRASNAVPSPGGRNHPAGLPGPGREEGNREPADVAGPGPELAHHRFRGPGAFGGPRHRGLGRWPAARLLGRVPAGPGGPLAAVTSGLTSLTQGAARVFEGGPVTETIVEMRRGVLLVMAISDGSSLAVLAAGECDMGLVAYEMALLVERVGRALTPEPRSALRPRYGS